MTKNELPELVDPNQIQAHLDPTLIRKVWVAHARMLQRTPSVLRKLTQDACSSDLPTRREARKVFLPYVQGFTDEYRQAVKEGDTSELLGMQDLEFTRMLKSFSRLYKQYGNEIIDALYQLAQEMEEKKEIE